MANNDWLNELTEMLSKTAQKAGTLAGSMYENQKLRSGVSAKEREIKKIMGEIGKIIFERYASGTAEYDNEILAMCEEIQEKLGEVAALNKDAADRRGKKICPTCGKEVDKAFQFCPFCGAECPVEQEEAEEETQEDGAEDSEAAEAQETGTEDAEDAGAETETEDAENENAGEEAEEAEDGSESAEE